MNIGDQERDALPNATSTSTPEQLCVYFDGSCPLCRREIAIYQDLPSLKPIHWIDVSNPDSPSAVLATQTTGKTVNDLMARFHVQSNGVTLSGASAFVQLWGELPGWRWLAKLAKVPGAIWLMERTYDLFLLVRPSVQRLTRRFVGD